MTRRELLRGIGALAAVTAAGCTPLKFLLDPHPSSYRNLPDKLDTTLRAFVVTIIPGAPADDPNLVRVYSDDYYPFTKFATFFANDLDTRSRRLYGNTVFASLSQAQREFVVKDGLSSDATMVKLYKAAIYAAKASFYGGIYDISKGCKLIDFQGSNWGFSDDEMFYPNAKQYFARELTCTGNYQ
ncbi:MAG TPA: hypothetical protein VEW28_03985 [Candidatus Kapabacteria bacterium]|nr:hypothetical protein [Candidatus Kapabacteria bacterium]